ncbi:DsrE/DsrF-like family protein [Novipirellula galeiformis]|uniref:DsrE/DsrF-like family protein n=1 Tax=Novipirellula galeiformis TaxID=2528004 RepID=A0A5C6CM97_9BACT|nr:DsrE family protein [Novipirellula galeiformis]TWU23969.1 DsrE/DsrF-like family protein [Novipirellula galeiformis]
MNMLRWMAAVMLLGTTAYAADPTGDAKYEHPVIKDHGGIVVLSDAAHQPLKNSKVLLDITSDSKSGSVIKGFDRAALILNQYAQATAGTDNGFKMAIILHGPATKAALSHEAYAKHTNSYLRDKGKAKNPNLELMSQLKKAGVEIYVCGQALAHHSYASGDVVPEVKVAVSAATVNINLQMDGYAYIPFK